MIPYLDTSALAAYYCPEPLSEVVQAEMRRARDVVISPLTEVEFCSAIGLKTRTGELDLASARRVLSVFRVHCGEGKYRMVAIGPNQYAMACEWLSPFATPLRALDALHLAVAASNDLEIVTADAGLARWAKDLGVKHRLLS